MTLILLLLFSLIIFFRGERVVHVAGGLAATLRKAVRVDGGGVLGRGRLPIH
jgi:hypothetical protein